MAPLPIKFTEQLQLTSVGILVCFCVYPAAIACAQATLITC
jgi:hypothetical protein